MHRILGLGATYIFARQNRSNGGGGGETDVHELFVFLAIASAAAHAMSNPSTRNRFRYFRALMAFGWLVILVLSMSVSVYRHFHNQTRRTDIDRGGCLSAQSLDKQFKMSSVCFLDKDRGPVHSQILSKIFLRYNLDKESFSSTMEVGNKLREYANSGTIELFQNVLLGQQNKTFKHEFLSLLDNDCFHKLLDVYCVDTIDRCETLQCDPPPFQCQSNFVADSVHLLLQCVADGCQQKSLKSDSSNLNCSVAFDAKEAANALKKIYFDLVRRIGDYQSEDFVNRTMAVVYRAVYLINEFGGKSLPQMPPSPSPSGINRLNYDMCDRWRVNLSSPVGTTFTLTTTTSSTNTSCDAGITSFMQPEDVTEIWDSRIMFAFTLAYLTVVVMVFNSSSGTQASQNTSTGSAVRICGFAIGLFMAALVYIGSVHILRDVLTNEDSISAGIQRKWRMLYLFVSYGCVHRGFLPSRQSAPSKGTSSSRNLDKPRQQSGRHACMSFITGATISFCGASRSRCLYTRFHLFMDTFWRAGGELFWLKLAILEILEIGLQLASVSSTAASSCHRDIFVGLSCICQPYCSTCLDLSFEMVISIFGNVQCVCYCITRRGGFR